MGLSFNWQKILSFDSPWSWLAVSPECDIDDAVNGSHEQATAPVVIRIIRGKRCVTAKSLFQEWAAALQFPSYFGENWDAFEECLTDLDWLPAKAYLIIVTNVDRLLPEMEKEFQTLLEILEEVAGEWAKERTGEWARPTVSFRVIFHSEPSQYALVRARLGTRVCGQTVLSTEGTGNRESDNPVKP